jgi:hypothetical protein
LVKGPFQQKFNGTTPTAVESSTSLTGPTLDFENLVVKKQFNKIAVQLSITLTGTVGDGTDPVSELISKLEVYKGSKKDVQTKKLRPILTVEDTSFEAIPIINALRSVVAPAYNGSAGSFLNEVMATNSTYLLQMEIPFNRGAGEYYIRMTCNSTVGLTGFTTDPVTATWNASVCLVDVGQPIGLKQVPGTKKMVLDEDYGRIAKHVDPKTFTIGGVREVGLLCASELTSVLASLSYDEVFTDYGIKVVETLTARQTQTSIKQAAAASLLGKLAPINPKTTATVIYPFYQTSDSPKDLNAKADASCTIIYFWFQ